LVLGGRVDNNHIRDTQGYGTVFNSRAAAVVSPGDYVFKLVYSEAFKAASNWAKYATSPSRGISNPDLQPEKVKNYELSTGWQNGSWAADLEGYWSSYSDVVGTARITLPDGTTTTQNQAVGKLRIRGIQANASWKSERLEFWGNYTYTDPANVEPRDNNGDLIVDAQGNLKTIRIGDIASHRINFGANAEVWKNLNLNARWNYVGTRKTGKETTIFDNPLDQIDAYWVLNGAVTWQHVVSRMSLQVTVNNIFDREYFDPGARTADGKILATRFPQNRRQAFLQVFADF
jgi:outer membrane receptor protein involved in Fe transport